MGYACRLVYGRLIRLGVKAGDKVSPGDQVAILEAMKMEHSLKARLDGTVKEIGAREGDQVDEGQLLVVLDPLIPAVPVQEP